MIDPVKDALTTSIRPCFRATTAMINSAAFPSVALRNPPMFSPARSATCSVALPNKPARGTIAPHDKAKISVCESGLRVLYVHANW